MEAISSQYRVVTFSRGVMHKTYFKTYELALVYFRNASYKMQAEIQERNNGCYLTVESNQD